METEWFSHLNRKIPQFLMIVHFRGHRKFRTCTTSKQNARFNKKSIFHHFTSTHAIIFNVFTFISNLNQIIHWDDWVKMFLFCYFASLSDSMIGSLYSQCRRNSNKIAILLCLHQCANERLQYLLHISYWQK